MKLKLIHNSKKPWAVGLSDKLSCFLQSHGHEIVDSEADATICIGGDGTILFGNFCNRLQGVVAGIGSNRSYLCQLEKSQWKGIINLLKKKSVKLMTLKATVGRKKYSVINDLVLHATDYRVISINVDNSTFRGDGIIISTALGSAGYAYSAGGGAIDPLSRKFVVVPICPYRRCYSAKTVPEDAVLQISTEEESALVIDGIFVKNFREKVKIEKGDDILFFEGVGKHKQGTDPKARLC
ncbi:NAD(+)/NADH kinase [Candidatus Micrarchaeota archaeon]|nr:NAD(+)/NADH kinase [Candidatus Micrarchaeota archaeon]